MKKLLLLSVLFCSCWAQADIAVIVSAASPITQVDANELEKLYLGKTKSVGGASASALNQKGSSGVTEQFNRIVLNKSNSQVKAYWSKLVFTGKGKPPKELASDAEVISAVVGDPSVIGYIDASAVTADVKVLTTLK